MINNKELINYNFNVEITATAIFQPNYSNWPETQPRLATGALGQLE
jgi:hypothetical protein